MKIIETYLLIVLAFNNINYSITQVPYHQQLLRKRYTSATQQAFPTYIMPASNMAMPPTMISDNSAMLSAAPYIPYMVNPSPVIQQQQQEHKNTMPLPGNTQTKTKQSKAVKIVNPETMKEVDIGNFTKTSPALSRHSKPNLTSEVGQVQQQLEQTIDTTVKEKDNKVCCVYKYH